MLIIITLAAITIFGVALIAFDGYYDSLLGVTCAIIGGTFLVTTLTLIALVQIPAETDYQKAVYQKEILEYRLENANENIVGNELLYNDIVEFNNNLISVKKWSKNYWVNWFYNAKIATIDYIKISELNPIQQQTP